jgi:CubicO group peptidase (beta-lactamase class C family)
VIEVATGQPFDEFLKTRLFGPMGMASTSFQPPSSAARRVAVLYSDQGGQRQTAYRFDPELRITNPAPNGGLFSTARDMAVFVQMFLNEGRYNGAQVLSGEKVRLMLADQTPNLPLARGLGWALGAPGTDRPVLDSVFTHSGSSGTFLWGDSRRGLVGIFFSQTSGPRVTEAHREFYGRIVAAVDASGAVAAWYEYRVHEGAMK